MENSKVIRVLHVIGMMNRGGAETMIMNLYRDLDRTQFQFDFVVHTQDEGAYDDEIRKLGGRIFQCPKFRVSTIVDYKKWWDRFFEAEGAGVEIVHGHIGSTAPVYLRCAKAHGKYAIAHSHNTKGNWSGKELLYRILSRRVRGGADDYLACSNRAGEDRFGRGIQFKVLKNAIPAKQYEYASEVRNRVRAELGIDKDLVVGHVGRFMSQKNHNFLIELFCHIVKKAPAKLLLVGDGELRATMEEKVNHLGLQDDVIFTGVRSDVAELMQAMDVFVFPSLYEGLPLSIVEAQAAGLPCLISDRVPNECQITDLVRQVPLSSGAEVWAEMAMEAAHLERKNTYEELCARGFDIENNVRMLERYYGKIAMGEANVCLSLQYSHQPLTGHIP